MAALVFDMSINEIDLSDALVIDRAPLDVSKILIPEISVIKQSFDPEVGTVPDFKFPTVAPIELAHHNVCVLPQFNAPGMNPGFRVVATQPMTGMMYKPTPTWIPSNSMW